jgi:hypothetical protein
VLKYANLRQISASLGDQHADVLCPVGCLCGMQGESGYDCVMTISDTDRAKRSRVRRLNGEGGRRVDLILSRQAGVAADRLGKALGTTSVTSTIETLLLSWRQPKRAETVHEDLQRIRIKCWYRLVCLSLLSFT